MYNEKELCYENTENSPSVIRKSLMSCLISATTLTSFHGHLSDDNLLVEFTRFLLQYTPDVLMSLETEREHTSHRDSLFLFKSTLASCSSAVPQLSVTNTLLVSTHTDTNNLAILWQSAFIVACWVQLNSSIHTCEHTRLMGDVEWVFIIYMLGMLRSDTDPNHSSLYASSLLTATVNPLHTEGIFNDFTYKWHI